MREDIFISYRREDGTYLAELLANALNDKGYSVFLDRRNIAPGAAFPEELEQAIKSCHDVVAVVTPMYFGAKNDNVLRIASDDDWVRKEISIALQEEKTIVPIYESVDPQKKFWLPDDISSITDRSAIKYDAQIPVEQFVLHLENSFSEATRKNRGTRKIVEYLANLPDERSRKYELEVTRYATSLASAQAETAFLRVIEGDYPEKICYNAFYCLNIVYRRAKDFYKLKELIGKYSSRFDKHVTFDHLEAIYYLDSDAIYDYTELLKKTYRDAGLLSDNAGFVHLFADVFATIYEKDGLHDKTEYIKKWYDDAIEAADRAIDLDPVYAKYYCTKARILCIKKDFSQALYNVDKAISLENSERADYSLRISTYQYHKLMIYTEMRLYELEEKFKAQASLPATAETSLVATKESRDHNAAFGGLLNYERSKPYVFISYSHEDGEKMRRIVSLLMRKGVRVWCDVDSIPTGIDYTEHIAEKIKGCKVFMPLISSNSVKSEYVRKEIGLASRQPRLLFFSVMLEDLVLSPGMDLQINSNQRVNWYANSEEKNIEQIIRDLPPEVFV